MHAPSADEEPLSNDMSSEEEELVKQGKEEYAVFVMALFFRLFPSTWNGTRPTILGGTLVVIGGIAVTPAIQVCVVSCIGRRC